MKVSEITQFNQDAKVLSVDYKFNDVHAHGHEWFDRPFANLKGIKLGNFSKDYIKLPDNPTWKEIFEGIDDIIYRSNDPHHRYLGFYNFEIENRELVVDENGYLNLCLDS